MTEQELIDLSRYSRHNLIHLESGECGCYFCLRTFGVDEIEDLFPSGIDAAYEATYGLVDGEIVKLD